MVGFQDMMKKAQALQTKMAGLEEKLKELEVEGSAGGGMVKIVLSGKNEARKVSIDKTLIKESEQEILEDLLLAALNDAHQKIEVSKQKEMSDAMGGMTLPPGMKIPGF